MLVSQIHLLFGRIKLIRNQNQLPFFARVTTSLTSISSFSQQNYFPQVYSIEYITKNVGFMRSNAKPIIDPIANIVIFYEITLPPFNKIKAFYS